MIKGEGKKLCAITGLGYRFEDKLLQPDPRSPSGITGESRFNLANGHTWVQLERSAGDFIIMIHVLACHPLVPIRSEQRGERKGCLIGICRGKTLASRPLTVSLVAGSATIGWPFEKRSSLESVAGWKTARVQRPVQILGRLDGIETGIRQLIRDQPLETITVDFNQLANPLPYDLKDMDLSTYKGLDSRWHD